MFLSKACVVFFIGCAIYGDFTKGAFLPPSPHDVVLGPPPLDRMIQVIREAQHLGKEVNLHLDLDVGISVQLRV